MPLGYVAERAARTEKKDAGLRPRGNKAGGLTPAPRVSDRRGSIRAGAKVLLRPPRDPAVVERLVQVLDELVELAQVVEDAGELSAAEHTIRDIKNIVDREPV